MKPGRRWLGAVELALLRLRLPRWFAASALDQLLSRQRLGTLEPEASELRHLEHDVPRVEALLSRLRLLPDSCLYRALARYALLRRRGFGASFVLGVDPAGLARAGHAWVEVDARPFAESEDVSRYRVTFRYPAQAIDGSFGA